MAPIAAYVKSPSLDAVLVTLGATHPCITIQLLISIGFFILSLGSPENSSLLPLPIDGCWKTIASHHFGNFCDFLAIIPSQAVGGRQSGICHELRVASQEVALIVVKIAFALIAGLTLDVTGRRRSAFVWYGIYFVFAFARSFSPYDETTLVCLCVENMAVLGASLALLLIATESSTQKECVRSASLVLLGHAVGFSAPVPVINYYFKDFGYRQLVRSLPAVYFVLLVFFLPESVRWVAGKGRLDEIRQALRRSHSILLENQMQGKLFALQQEIHRSLAKCNSLGSPMKQSVKPLFTCLPVLRVSIVLCILAFAFGIATGAGYRMDPLPYSSFEDRMIAFGVVEFHILLLAGLLLARLAAKKVLLVVMVILPGSLFILPLLETVGIRSCAGNIMLSCMAHLCMVLAGIWIFLTAIRYIPSHSRGSALGLVAAMMTFGRAVMFYSSHLLHDIVNEEYYILFVWIGVVLLAGVLSLLLPRMPIVLPDNILHLAPTWIKEQRAVNGEEENTKL